MTTEEESHLRFIRRHIPEPSQFPYPVLRFRWPSDPPMFTQDSDVVPDCVSVSTGELKKVLFIEGSTKYWGWTYDGKTPLFPEWD